MGILNVTPDSFSDGGEYYNLDKAIEYSLDLVNQGADIIDVGGESSRPGSQKISYQEEIDRIKNLSINRSEISCKEIIYK